MAKVRHVFVTHSHLDHVAFIPLLVDSVFELSHEPLIIHGLPETLRALKQHIFNCVIWPDINIMLSLQRPVMVYAPMQPGEVIALDWRCLEMIPVAHAVPSVVYRIACAGGALAFSGDTTTNNSFWAGHTAHARLDILIVETAFANAALAISRLAKHYCQALLAEDLGKLRHRPQLYIPHNTPGEEDVIFAECQAALAGRPLRRWSSGDH